MSGDDRDKVQRLVVGAKPCVRSWEELRTGVFERFRGLESVTILVDDCANLAGLQLWLGYAMEVAKKRFAGVEGASCALCKLGPCLR